MKLLVIVQIAWAIVVLLFAGFQFFAGRGLISGLSVVVMVVYLYASIVLLERARWAWWLSLLPPIGSLVLYGPPVGYNLWRASQLDPLFSDSPGTLLVVLVLAFIYVIPPIMLLLRLAVVKSEVLPNKTMEPTR